MITLQLANEMDCQLIGKLAKEIWYDHYIPIIGQEQVDYMLAELYSSNALINQMKTGQNFFLIKNEKDVIGFLAISERAQHEVFIHKFYIDTAIQGKGIGAQVMNLIEQQWKEWSTMKLTVNRQNFKSINFYFKCGFIIDSVEDFDIGKGYFMNDFVMIRKRNN